MRARCVLAQPYSMASLGGKKPKPVNEREWEKLLSGQIPCTSIKSVDETIRFRSDRGKWYFHLNYNPVGHSKSKRVTVKDQDESYVLGARQRLLASLLFKQQGSAQDQQPLSPPSPPTTQPVHTPTTSMISTLCRAVKVKLTYQASDTRGGSRSGAGRRYLRRSRKGCL